MRLKSKSAFTHNRPQTTPHPPCQQLNCTYKYLTLSPRSNQNLTPYLPSVTRILNKIGTSKKNTMFEPDQDEQKDYTIKRYKELKRQFSKHREGNKFEFEIDQVVLDCYDYRVEQGRRSIWKKYRSKVDDLSFKVLRMRQGRRGSGLT